LPPVENDVDPLRDFDCIILGDVAPEDLPAGERQRLQEYVNERGGTLVLVAGKRFMPLAYDDEANEFAPLLPIAEPRIVKPAAGFPLKFTHEGSITPFLQLDPVPERNTQSWSKMMPHFWGVVGKVRPAATALAYYEEPSEKTERPHESQVLFARQNYGFGKVLFIGIDSTWRWRYRAGDTYHHRFWGQIVRWAAADRLLPAGNRLVRFGSRDPVYREGQPVEVLARLSADAPPLPKDARATARIFRGDDAKNPIAQLELRPSEAQQRLLQGSVGSLPSGTYQIVIDVPHLKEKLDATGAQFSVIAGEQQEFRDLSADWDLLDELARKTKGELFTAENVEQLVDLFARQITIREHRDEQKLWQDAPLVWWLLAVMLLLVTVEWVGRKIVGLP
jgi:hypothetical protein